ncbi:MAG: hypothetical protein ACREMP_09335 [Candidatus Tyrphobacter sp.]
MTLFRRVLGPLAIVAVVILDATTATRAPLAGEVATTLLFLAYSIYCIANFALCRETHCAITGPGFLLAAGTAAGRIFDASISPGIPWLVFIGAYVLGMAVEYAYSALKGGRSAKS